MSPENESRIATIRQRVLAKTATIEDQIEAVRILRADRYSAATGAAKKVSKAAAKTAALNVNADDLLNEMLGDSK